MANGCEFRAGKNRCGRPVVARLTAGKQSAELCRAHVDYWQAFYGSRGVDCDVDTLGEQTPAKATPSKLVTVRMTPDCYDRLVEAATRADLSLNRYLLERSGLETAATRRPGRRRGKLPNQNTEGDA